MLHDHAVEIAGDVAHDAGAWHLERSHRFLELCRQLAGAWSFYIFSSGSSADELFFRDLDLEFLQKFGVFDHFLA